MPSMEFVCTACGGAISHNCQPQSGAAPGAIVTSNGEVRQVAHGSEVLDLDPATKRARAYNQDYDPEFVRFWKAYPLHRDKRKAQRAWRNAIRRASADAIRLGAIRYREDPNRLPQFTKYAEGWLNGDCWEDEPLPSRLAPGVQPSPRRQSHEEILAEADRAIHWRQS